MSQDTTELLEGVGVDGTEPLESLAQVPGSPALQTSRLERPGLPPQSLAPSSSSSSPLGFQFPTGTHDCKHRPSETDGDAPRLAHRSGLPLGADVWLDLGSRRTVGP